MKATCGSCRYYKPFADTGEGACCAQTPKMMDDGYSYRPGVGRDDPGCILHKPEDSSDAHTTAPG
jgi:hypothetical protein